MKIAISAESTIDLSKELLEKYDIKTVPFTILLGEETMLDGESDTTQIFDYVDRTNILPKTSAVNEFQYEEHFESLFKDYDAIVHFTLSSELSSAYQNASNVAGKMKNVYVVNSLSLSSAIGLLAIYGRKLANKGFSPKDIADKCRNRIKFLQASFVVNTLDYLYKGGRCSALAKFGANLLRLKPQIIVNTLGKMESAKSFRGKNDIVIANYCDSILETYNNPDKSIAFVTHSHASPDMVEVAKNKLREAGFKDIYETIAGATISSHCGPKCLGILYINDGLQEE